MNESKQEIWFESAGTRLFAVERGEGEAVVFLHGGLADHQASEYRLGGLASTHRVITPDVRAAGRSVHAGELSWDMLADDVVALLDGLAIDRAIVGGVSAGSGIALRVALRHPTRARALVLVAPTFAGNERGQTEAQRAAKVRMHAAGERALTEGIDALMPLYAALPTAIRELATSMARRFDPASVAATTRFLASGVQPFDRIEELAGLTMKTVVVPGTDPEHPREVAELYASTMPRCRLGHPDSDLAGYFVEFLA
jgi:pimeloyl-ACP methyl ester carboxylesterase